MMGGWECEADRFEARVGRGDFRRLTVDSPAGRRIDIYESPKGRNHYVYVDGVRYLPGPSEEQGDEPHHG